MSSTGDDVKKEQKKAKVTAPQVTVSFVERPNQNKNKTNRAQPTSQMNSQRLFPMVNSPQAISAPGRAREKVKLAPNHSALHWEKYKRSNNVKNIDPSNYPLRITKQQLAEHNTRDDCWMALGGKIYNITAYLDYHPGGVDILLKYAGRDATPLFMKYHRWVNFERILDECFIGFIIA
jgi:cytochrome b involved in lipid metabolism